ncbi:MAG: ABC transporter ATP-binding protein [Actinomycetes bacterium]
MSCKPLLHLDRVSRVFGSGAARVNALEDVDLRLDTGELALIIGPSGSGKTTLLMIAGAMLTASSGEVYLNDAPLSQLRARELARIRLLKIGFVFQSFNLFPALSALDNVALPASLAGMGVRKRRKRAAQVLDRLGLGERLRHLPEQLSAGEKQRVALGRALINDPPLLLADEPTANLDSVSGRNVLALFREIAADEGRAVLVVTHDARIIDSSDRVMHLVDGRLGGDGDWDKEPESAAAPEGTRDGEAAAPSGDQPRSFANGLATSAEDRIRRLPR